jgi:voltage-gated potassium channel
MSTPGSDVATHEGRARPEGAREARFAAYRYGIVLLILLATFLLLASSPPNRITTITAVVLQGATLLAALSASEVGQRWFRIAAAVVLVSIVSTALSLATDSTNVRAGTLALSALMVAGAPAAIAVAIKRRATIDTHTVLGAICFYVLLGMLWAFIYLTLGTASSEPFFAQTDPATTSDYLYFSFVTLTTVGYGDLTAVGDLGRALAVLEALIGQLYLVTVLALLVSQLGRSPRHA